MNEAFQNIHFEISTLHRAFLCADFSEAVLQMLRVYNYITPTLFILEAKVFEGEVLNLIG